MTGVIIAGDRSGSGKTTITLALLSTFRMQGETVQAFKVGPDYIDPMFHRAITGRPAYNLDPVLTSEAYVQTCFQRHSATASYAVVEGVMGLFDGAGGTNWASTAHIARLIGCPVLLVVDCARLSRSLAAIVHGYATLDARITIAGVVLNRVGSDRHAAMLQAAMAMVKIPVLGIVHREDAIALPDRHLGLVPTDEFTDLPERFRHLAALGQRCFDWVQLAAIFRGTRPTTAAVPRPQPKEPTAQSASQPEALAQPDGQTMAAPVRLGIARDRAFNFYYEDNLQQLMGLGAILVPFSPLTDTTLPPNLAGLYLGGGFPEVFAEELAQNRSMRHAIAQSLTRGTPTYAECGGLMYLCRHLIDFAGRSWPMVGAIAATTTMTGTLTLGYRHVTVHRASPLVQPGQWFWGHEFHRSTIEPAPAHPLYTLMSYPLPNGTSLPLPAAGWATPTLHGSYVHSHWGIQETLPRQFLNRCIQANQRHQGRVPPCQ